MKGLIYIIAFTSIAIASSTRDYKVTSIRKSEKGTYKIGLAGHPGVYIGEKKDVRCFVKSYKNQLKVKMSITKTLKINSCK